MDHNGPITAILAAMTRLGEADTRTIAVEAGIAYSTTVKKLRGLAADGRALRRDDGTGPALWRTADTDTPPESRGTAGAQPVSDLDTEPAPATTTGPTEDSTADAGPARPDHASPTVAVDPTTATDVSGTDEHDTLPVIDPPVDLRSRQPTGATPTAPPGNTRGDAPHDDTATPDAAEHTEPDNRAGAPAHDTTPAISDTAGSAEPGTPGPNPGEAHTIPTGESTTSAAPSTVRRGKGKLRDEVRAVLQDNPDTAYKVSQLSKALGGASQGAITNALHKLVTDGTVTQTVERPATYQAN
jgi:hypothetical protein